MFETMKSITEQTPREMDSNRGWQDYRLNVSGTALAAGAYSDSSIRHWWLAPFRSQRLR